MEYPKINSLYKREGCGPYDEETKRYVIDLEKKPRKSALILGQYACQEFSAIKTWSITEKVDGTNIRVILDRNGTVPVNFGGRTANAQIPAALLQHLQQTFTFEKLGEVFKESNYTVLFGEGYGGKIQLPAGGKHNPYRSDLSFCLFDVFCSGWWLEYEDVMIVADKLGIEHAPIISKPNPYDDWNTDEIVEFVKSKPKSIIANDKDFTVEGIIARSCPQMMFRKGGPIMFKLKCKDF